MKLINLGTIELDHFESKSNVKGLARLKLCQFLNYYNNNSPRKDKINIRVKAVNFSGKFKSLKDLVKIYEKMSFKFKKYKEPQASGETTIKDFLKFCESYRLGQPKKAEPKKEDLSDKLKEVKSEILKRLNKVNERKVKSMGQNQQEEEALYMYVKTNAPNSKVLQIENSPVVKDNRKFYIKGPKRFIFSKSTDKKTIDFIEKNKQAPKKEEPKKETKKPASAKKETKKAEPKKAEPKPVPKKEQPKSNEKVDDLVFKTENNPNYNDNYNTLVTFLQKTKEKNIFPIELTFAFSQKQNEENFKALDSNPKLFMDFMAELAKGIKDNNDLNFNILKKYDKKPSNMSVKSQKIIIKELNN